MTGSLNKSSSRPSLNASQRRKKIAIRALRLRRHRKEAQTNVRKDMLAIGIPTRRAVHALRDPLRRPVMTDPEY